MQFQMSLYFIDLVKKACEMTITYSSGFLKLLFEIVELNQLLFGGISILLK